VAYDEQLADRIRVLVDTEPGVTEKRMFGGLAFLINGNMSVSASGQGGLLLRVDPEQTDALLDEPHAQPFVMRGRAMDGWLRVDPAGTEADADLRKWVSRGVAYARTLPPK
jgi:TfoX/Sxy family transcriptional regulator of competence genes